MSIVTVLVTGFEPFHEFKTNPAQLVAERLHGQVIGGAQVVGLTLPVVFGEDTKRTFPALAELQPRLVLSLGLGAGAPCLHVERIAVNLRLCDSCDGVVPIVADGPAAYFATIDVDHVSQAILRRSVPAQARASAGDYLCNHLMYQTLHRAATHTLPLQAGFIHLPLATEQAVAEKRVNTPSLPLEAIVAGVSAAIEAALS